MSSQPSAFLLAAMIFASTGATTLKTLCRPPSRRPRSRNAGKVAAKVSNLGCGRMVRTSDVTQGEGKEWTPPTAPDYFVLGLACTWQLFALAVCVHLVVNRRWPPYVTKNVSLVAITGLFGVLWFVSMVSSWGFVDRKPGDFLATCVFETVFGWWTLAVHVGSFLLRPYRVWKLLVRHDGHMWSAEAQLVVATVVLTMLPIAAAVLGSSGAQDGGGMFDEHSNTCHSNELSRLTAVAMDIAGVVIMIFLWGVCVRQLRGVRKQFNEYRNLTCSLLVLSAVALTYPTMVSAGLHSEPVVQRRMALLFPVLTSYVLFWTSIWEPFRKKLSGDAEYLFGYTQGFSLLPTPAQLKASLAEQLSVDQLRVEFRKYIEGRVAQELIDFYQESLNREEVEDFFERQAVTMRIIDRYIRVGSKDEVNLSQACRENVVAMDVTAYNIFDESRSEVLRLMETNFHRAFAHTSGFRKIADAAEKEAQEIKLLTAGGVMPGPDASRMKSIKIAPRTTVLRRGESLPAARGGERPHECSAKHNEGKETSGMPAMLRGSSWPSPLGGGEVV